MLVVDDDRDIREAVIAVLQGEGYETSVAANGREALDQLKAGLRPCVILLDLMMPVMDGRQFRVDQLKDRDLKAIPVVAMTAAGDTAEKIQAELSCAAVLRKPMSLDGLLVVIAGFCIPPTP